jgi:hypothetical protein
MTKAPKMKKRKTLITKTRNAGETVYPKTIDPLRNRTKKISHSTTYNPQPATYNPQPATWNSRLVPIE